MCGHGLVTPWLVEDTAKKVKEGKLSLREAAVKLARPCVCVAFNPKSAKNYYRKWLKKCRKSDALLFNPLD